MELRFIINDRAIDSIREHTDLHHGTDIGREACELLAWAAAEAAAGRQIQSVNPTGGAVHVPIVGSFNRGHREV